MIVTVLHHEWRRIRRDRALLLLLALFAGLTAFAATTGATWVEARTTAVRGAIEDARRPMTAQVETAIKVQRAGRPAMLRPVAFSYIAALEPLPLASLSIGQADGYPFAARFLPLMDRHAIFDQYGAGTENPRVLAAGRFDLAFLLVFLLPVFLLAATYDVWAEERDRGTAGLVLAQPIRPVSLLATKALARGAAVLLPAIVMTLGALMLVSKPDVAGLAALTGMILLYGLFWIGLALAINVFARRASEAAVAAGAAWLILVVIAPALIAAAVDIVLPPASRADLVNAVRLTQLEAQEAGGSIALLGRRELVGLSPLEMQARFSGGRLAEVRAGEAKVAPIAREVAERDAMRVRVTQVLRLFVPSVAFQNGLDRIAGSDAERAADFQSSAIAYLDQSREFFAKFIAQNRLMGVADLRDVPRYTAPPASLAPLLVDAGALLAAALLVLLIAAVGFRQRRLFES